MKPPAPLPDELEDLLDAERDIDPPTAAERERLLTRLAPLMLPPAATSDIGHATGAGAASMLKAKIGIALVSAAIGAGGGAAGHAYYVSKRTPPAVVTATTVAPPVVTSVAAPTVASETPALVESAPPVPSATAAPSARGPSTLRAERLLIETASAALVRGDKAAALAALEKHAQRFPKGQLAPEREVLLKAARAK